MNSNTSIHVCQEFDETWETSASLENQIAVVLSGPGPQSETLKSIKELVCHPHHHPKSING